MNRLFTPGMVWLQIGIVGLLAIGYLSGMSVNDRSEQNQRHQIECIQAGGHMLHVDNSVDLVCNK